jgi:trk system potassium uptake protein TrkH
LVYSFLALIAAGTILLWLPISSTSKGFSNVTDAFFTATSAVCVTGLVVVNTAQYWNTFGQIVILVLVQLGGFGIMTGATLVLLSLRGRIGLQQRLLTGQSFGQAGMGGVVGLLKRMALFVLITETFGALAFFIRFSADNSVVKAA